MKKLRIYFIKNTKYENTGINNKIPFITTITSAFEKIEEYDDHKEDLVPIFINLKIMSK